MQEKNITTNTYWSDNERFADVVNVGMFKGKKLLLAKQLEEKDSYLGSIQGKKGIQRWHDIVKKADFNANFAIVGLENQDEIHYAIPVRVMGYEYLEYDKQLKLIKKEHQKKKDLEGAEYLAGFSEEDRLAPIFTLVLYYGKEPWKGPEKLSDILNFENIPEELREKVVDYPIHVIDMRRFKDSEKLETDARLLFGFLQREGDKEALRTYCTENQAEFENMTDDAFDAIAILTDSKGLLTMKEEHRNEGGKMDMCKALQDMVTEGEARGEARGRQEMLIEVILELLYNLGEVPADIKKKIADETDMQILNKWFKIAAKSETIEEFAKSM